MISEYLFQSLLIILLLFLSILRILFLWNFNFSFANQKIHLALGFSNVTLSATLVCLFWSHRLPLWRQIFLGVASALPSSHEVGLNSQDRAYY
jgi:hypothetical protein